MRGSCGRPHELNQVTHLWPRRWLARTAPRGAETDPVGGRLDVTGSAGRLPASAPHGAESAVSACVVLHVDDQPVTKAQVMRPLLPGAVAVGPRDDDRDAAVPLLDPFDPQVVVAFSGARFDRSLECLTRLIWAVSRRDGFPEPPRAPAPPLQVRVHQRDEWLDVAGFECFESGPDAVRPHACTRLPASSEYWPRPAFRAARRVSASSIGEKSGQPI